MKENDTVVDNEITLKEIIDQSKIEYQFLLSKWKIIVIVGLLGGLLGLCYSYIRKPIYTATLSFALEDDGNSGGGLGGALGFASSLGFDIGGSGGGAFVGANLPELFKSRSMVEKALLNPIDIDGTKTSLAEVYIQDHNWREDWEDDTQLAKVQFLPKKGNTRFTRVQDSILGVMYKDLSENVLSVAQKNKKISIVNIDVVYTNEVFAKYFTEALAKEVSNFYIDTKSKKARLNMTILERQTDSIRNELNQAIAGVAIANDNTFNLNPALNVKRIPSSRKQVDVQADGAVLAELIKQTELAKVTLRRETPLIQIIDRPIFPLKKDRVGKIKGILLGGFLFGFLAVLYILVKKYLKNKNII